VILEPAAVLDIVGFMFWDYAGMAILDQRSFLTGRIGTELFGDNITIWDDVAHPLQTGAPFDGEGVPRQRLALVENGIVKRVVYARATAERMKRSEYKDKVGPIEATGHGFALPNEMGEMPQNIVFAPVGQSADGRADDCVDRTRSAGHAAVVHPRSRALRKDADRDDARWNVLCREWTRAGRSAQLPLQRKPDSHAVECGGHERAGAGCGEESMDMVVPAMKVKDFNFTEVTKF
jgi:hypothetical protein